jgi:hypothetical protein
VRGSCEREGAHACELFFFHVLGCSRGPNACEKWASDPTVLSYSRSFPLSRCALLLRAVLAAALSAESALTTQIRAMAVQLQHAQHDMEAARREGERMAREAMEAAQARIACCRRILFG